MIFCRLVIPKNSNFGLIVVSVFSSCINQTKQINNNKDETHYVYKKGFTNHENTLLSDYKNVSNKFVSSDSKYVAVTSGNSEYLITTRKYSVTNGMNFRIYIRGQIPSELKAGIQKITYYGLFPGLQQI